ncbi:MAG: gliding motility protein GldN [Flavobacteriaceae bacterium]|jgi:gliding motility associated protien GldN|nr:gliding motility protein GldN [Flavobacteriaceae bacterium]
MKYLIICLTALISSASFAQFSILNAESPEELRLKREEAKQGQQNDSLLTPFTNQVLPYGFIEDKDILWSMVVWEIIDLNEKLNQPYYHTYTDSGNNNNKSLYDVLFDGINSGEIAEVYEDEEFTSKVSKENITSKIQAVRTSDWFLDKINSGEKITKEDSLQGIDHIKTDTKTIKLVKIKGMWYIDKRLGQMKYRLLGIAPMGPDPQMLGLIVDGYTQQDELIDLFWVYYPDARKTLSYYYLFNPRNSASPVTFDDALNARRFNSMIYKSEGGLGDGNINGYIPADAEGQLEESQRIKRLILSKENNMWNY